MNRLSTEYTSEVRLLSNRQNNEYTQRLIDNSDISRSMQNWDFVFSKQNVVLLLLAEPNLEKGYRGSMLWSHDQNMATSTKFHKSCASRLYFFVKFRYIVEKHS